MSISSGSPSELPIRDPTPHSSIGTNRQFPCTVPQTHENQLLTIRVKGPKESAAGICLLFLLSNKLRFPPTVSNPCFCFFPLHVEINGRVIRIIACILPAKYPSSCLCKPTAPVRPVSGGVAKRSDIDHHKHFTPGFDSF